ncbi:MAG TPA: type I restriction endonuclease, partial [Bacteroidales bacterium]|nr:type I restriction endonuclease [Bacteroidales bacterium]
MDLKDQLKQIADKINKFKDSTQTEEATKNAFIMPFINALGYDIFNPQEVVPEFVADIGLKKGEKVDYAILRNNIPVILIECKHWRENLDIHNTQLIRYFNVTKAKFAILTNGINYRFYTDLEEPNKMD